MTKRDTPQRPARRLEDGTADRLIPLEPLDPMRIGTFDELVTAMSRTSFGGRALGEAADVLTTMVRDPDCFVVGTFSGAMSVAKMGLILCRMIETGMIQAVVTTGALMAHGLSESVGLVHFKSDPTMGDAELFAKGYNRIYDTIELEQNLNTIDQFVEAELERLDPSQPWSSEGICRALGKALAEQGPGPGILRSAYVHGVPVYIPAFTDSEIGLDVATWKLRKVHAAAGGGGTFDIWAASQPPPFNPFLDLLSYARLLRGKKRLGIFTIGGGVPRNWAQQVAPFYEIVESRLGLELENPRFQFGVRICPEPVHWGGLSGCTYSEGVSWGKFVPPAEGGRYAEVFADATVAWPLLVRAVLERLGKIPAR